MQSAFENKFVMLDEEFHITLIRSTKNPLFVMMMEAIADVYHESVSKSIGGSDEDTKKKLLVLHRKIFNSIVEKDEEACLKYLNEHYDFAESRL